MEHTLLGVLLQLNLSWCNISCTMGNRALWSIWPLQQGYEQPSRKLQLRPETAPGMTWSTSRLYGFGTPPPTVVLLDWDFPRSAQHGWLSPPWIVLTSCWDNTPSHLYLQPRGYRWLPQRETGWVSALSCFWQDPVITCYIQIFFQKPYFRRKNKSTDWTEQTSCGHKTSHVHRFRIWKTTRHDIFS